MFTVIITEKGGAQQRLTFQEPEVTIGRVPGNDIVLPKGNVSKRHSRIVLKDSRFIVVDLKSTNGTYVNGRKITSPLVVKDGDKIYIGDYIMMLEGDAAQAAPSEAMRQPSVMPPPGDAADPPQPSPSQAADPMADEIASESSRSPAVARPPVGSNGKAPDPSVPPVFGMFSEQEQGGESTEAGPPAPVDESPPSQAAGKAKPRGDSSSRGKQTHGNGHSESAPRNLPPVRRMRSSSIPPAMQDDLRSLMQRLGRDLDTDNADPSGLLDERRWEKAERAIQHKLGELANDGTIESTADRARLASAALHEAVGLGPLDGLLAEDAVLHIIVERFDRVHVDRGAGLTAEEAAFSSPHGLLVAARRLLAQAGIPDQGVGTFDFSLANGLHVVGALPSAATGGPVISLRRRPRIVVPLAELRSAGVLDEAQQTTLTEALGARKNVLFVGPRASDLATLMASALETCPPEQRVLVFEHAPELAVGVRSAICLKRGPATLTDLAIRARHFRADRNIVHELAPAELTTAITLLLSHSNGSLASMERSSAQQALVELNAAARTLGVNGYEQVLGALPLVVGLVQEGTRGRVASIYSLTHEGNALTLVD